MANKEKDRVTVEHPVCITAIQLLWFKENNASTFNIFPFPLLMKQTMINLSKFLPWPHWD